MTKLEEIKTALKTIGEAYSGINNNCSDIKTDFNKEYTIIEQALYQLECKEQPQKVSRNNICQYICPKCKVPVFQTTNANYCGICGTRLNWRIY